MKLLTIDIETSPHLGFFFGLFNQNFSINQVQEWTRVLCFAAKWYDQKDTMFFSDFHDGHEAMIQQAYNLLSEADAVVHFNGDSFDIPHLNREFALLDLGKPASYTSIDLYKVAKKNFRFGSNKLDHIAQQLGIGQKVKHAGFQLWIDVLNGKIKAWNEMREYNKQDVVITEGVYDKLYQWIPNVPNMNLYNETTVLTCRCGSENVEKRGFGYTQIAKYQKFKCRDCGRWNQSGKATFITDLR